MNDDRIARALRQQADTITLTPADPTGTMRRGNRRRTRRRAGLAGAVAIAGVLATTVAVRESGDDQQLQLGSAANASASTYQWSVVTPKTGLGYGWMASGSAQTADGTVYSISTAPGAAGTENVSTPALYRSADGAEWDQRTLPGGVRTYGLAGAGDTLYGVGTAPSGGVVLSASHDGAGSWSTAANLPDDVQQLKARHPDQIQLGVPEVAARDASHIVVTVVASTNLDLAKLGHPEYAEGSYSSEYGADGVKVYETPQSGCESTPTTAVDPAANETPESEAQVKADAAGVATCRAEAANQKEQARANPVASFTYDELGVTGELRDHLGGKPYVYVSDDGSSFHRVDLPADALPPGNGGGMLALRPLATPDGFRIFASGYNRSSATQSTVLRSADGSAWAPDGSFPNSVSDVGVVGGHAAFLVWGDHGATVQIEGDSGWTPIDTNGLVPTPDGGGSYLSSVAFGPLGMAAVIGVSDQSDSFDREFVVHSADGINFQVVDVSEHIHTGGMVSGLVVTPDAIAARVTTPRGPSDGTPPKQEVLVGTPQ